MPKKATTDIFSLFSSSLTGQIIHIVALPYLAAYFNQTEIGSFFFFQALVTMGVIFVSLQSEQAIVVESSENSYFCFKKSIQIVILISLLAFIVVNQFSFVISYISHKSTITSWIDFVPIGLVIVGINNTTEYLWTFEKKFKLISVIRIARPLLIYLSIITLKILYGDLKNLLILGFIAGNSTILLYQVYLISKNRLCRFTRKDFSFDGFKVFYKKHKNILIFNTLSSGIITTSMQVPYIFISAIFGESYSAFYGMAMRIVGMPLSLLGQSFGQVYFQKFSFINYQKHSIYPHIKRLMYRTYALGIGPIILLLVFAPFLYHLFLGTGWDMAASLSRVILPWLFVLMVSSPLSNVISVIGIQRKTIFYDIALFTARVIGLFLCWKMATGFIVTMAVFSIIGVIFNLVFQFLILYFSKIHNPTA